MRIITDYIVIDRYSPTGLRWIKSPTRSVKAGDVAFKCLHTAGYYHGWFDRHQYYAHRVVWFLHYGEWTTECIDHINGIRTDNRIENLRSVSKRVNLKNSKRRVDNKTGVTGVSLDTSRSRYNAAIRIKGKDVYLGRFKTIEEAAAAVKAARTLDKEYSDRHGKDGIQYLNNWKK